MKTWAVLRSSFSSTQVSHKQSLGWSRRRPWHAYVHTLPCQWAHSDSSWSPYIVHVDLSLRYFDVPGTSALAVGDHSIEPVALGKKCVLKDDWGESRGSKLKNYVLRTSLEEVIGYYKLHHSKVWVMHSIHGKIIIMITIASPDTSQHLHTVAGTHLQRHQCPTGQKVPSWPLEGSAALLYQLGHMVDDLLYMREEWVLEQWSRWTMSTVNLELSRWSLLQASYDAMKELLKTLVKHYQQMLAPMLDHHALEHLHVHVHM